MRKFFILILLCVFYFAHSSAIAQTQDELALELKLQQVQFLIEEKQLLFSVRLKTQERCMFGDLDIMMLDTLNSKDPKLLLTIENLYEPSSVLASVNLLEEKQGAQKIISGTSKHLLKIPANLPASVYGIFICKDTVHDESCFNKEVTNISNALLPFRTGSGSKKMPFSTDKIYFFSPFFLVKNAVFFPARNMSETRIRFFQNYTLGSLSDAQRNRFDNVTKLLQKYISQLGSMPALASDEDMILTLPRFHKKKCQSKSLG